MNPRAIALALLLLPACDQVFGVDPPAPPVLRGTFEVRRVLNDAMGVPRYEVVPPDPVRASVTATFADRSQRAIELAEDGSFEIERPDASGRYRLMFQLDNQLIEVQHTAPELAYEMFQLGRPNEERTPPIQQTLVATPLTLSKVYFASTGLWSWTEAANDVTTTRIDWRHHASLFGRRGLLDASRGDRLYALRYESDGLFAPNVLASYTMREVTMVDGESVDLPLGETQVPATSCGAVTAPVVEEGTRFAAALPGWTDLAVSARLQATPDLSFGATAALDLVFSAAFADRDLTRTVRYGNPFPATSMIASTRYELKRTLRAPGLLPVVIPSRLEHYVEIAGGDQCASPIALHGAVAIPGAASLDGTPLLDDGTPVRLDRSRDSLLTWEASDGPVDRYAVQLVEVYEEVFFGFALSRVIRTYVTVDRELVIDPALLVPGAFYAFMIRADAGFPGAASGALTEYTYPRSVASTYTGLFVIQ